MMQFIVSLKKVVSGLIPTSHIVDVVDDNIGDTYNRGVFTYESTIDEIDDLEARFCYDTGRQDMPIYMLMHTYNGGHDDFLESTMERLASYGVFVVAVGMRGRNGAGGNPDNSARELHDIIDACEHVISNYTNVDDSNKIISGYSGGGGNTMGAFVKFPDYFNLYVAHFPMTDYGFTPTGWWYTNATGITFNSITESRIGGTPATHPNEYKSRNTKQSVNNFGVLNKLIIFHDEMDNIINVSHSDEVSALIGVNTNFSYYKSLSGDTIRYFHEFPTPTSNVINSELLFKDILETTPRNEVPDIATIVVSGYIVTSKFSIWLGDGTSRSASVTYDLTANTFNVTPLLEAGATDVEVNITQVGLSVIQTISIPTILTAI